MVQCFFHGTGQTFSKTPGTRPDAMEFVSDGVCVEIRLGAYRIVLDCGLRDLRTLRELNAPDVLLCSHAHIDHSRSIADLQACYPDLPSYSTAITAALIAQEFPEVQLQRLPWQTPIELLPHLTVQLFPAGHLPGAAVFLLTYTGDDRPETVLYCGDFCLSNTRLTEGLKLDALRLLTPDILIIEGTYGVDRHPPRRQLENQLMELLDRTLLQGRSVLMPVPKLGLAQELLILLRSHHLFSGRDVVIEIDEAIATYCTQYEAQIAHLPSAIQNFARYQSLFLDRTVRPYVQRLELTDLDEPLPTTSSPRIVLSSTIAPLHHLAQTGDWQILLPQYRAQELTQAWTAQTLDRPAGTETFSLPVETYLLPEHCDSSSLGQVIHTLRPQHLVLIHADADQLSAIASLEDLSSRYKIHIPTDGQLLDLTIAETFDQPAPPARQYEGDLIETQTEVLLSFPMEIIEDPRWKAFADTGLLSATWQDGKLIIRGITQKEWLTQARRLQNPNGS